MEQPSLRARKKAAAMHHIQECALELFERDGFDAVTIEQVAARAEVSPSTVYRYFGTKEGLVLDDEFDDLALPELVRSVTSGEDPFVTYRRLVPALFAQHFASGEHDQTRRRTTLWMENPSVRRAGLVKLEQVVEDGAAALSQLTGLDPARARAAAGAMVWPLLSGIRNWYDAGADPETWREHLDLVLELVPERLPGPRAGTAG